MTESDKKKILEIILFIKKTERNQKDPDENHVLIPFIGKIFLLVMIYYDKKNTVMNKMLGVVMLARRNWFSCNLEITCENHTSCNFNFYDMV